MSSSFFIQLFHILFVGPLFLYIGIKQKEMPSLMFKASAFLGGFIILYHSYKAYLKFAEKKAPWVNLIHILLVGPLLLIIGINGEKTPRYMFEILFMLAFAVIGYHGYYLAIGE